MDRTIGDRALETREKLGLSRTDVHTRMVLACPSDPPSASWLALVETGKTRDPQCSATALLARALGVDLTWLVTGKGPRGPR